MASHIQELGVEIRAKSTVSKCDFLWVVIVLFFVFVLWFVFFVYLSLLFCLLLFVCFFPPNRKVVPG